MYFVAEFAHRERLFLQAEQTFLGRGKNLLERGFHKNFQAINYRQGSVEVFAQKLFFLPLYSLQWRYILFFTG